MDNSNETTYLQSPSGSRVDIVVHPDGDERTRTISFNTSEPLNIKIEMEHDLQTFYSDIDLMLPFVTRASDSHCWIGMESVEVSKGADGVNMLLREIPDLFDVGNVLTGAAFGTRDENAVPTPEELWGELLTMPPEERNKRLERFIDAQDTDPMDEYRQERLEECGTEVSRVWKSGTKSPHKEGYYARRDSVKGTWPELAEAVDRLSRVL